MIAFYLKTNCNSLKLFCMAIQTNNRFACNTRMIVHASSNPLVSNVKRCNRNLVSIHQVKKQTLHHQSITQMVIR